MPVYDPRLSFFHIQLQEDFEKSLKNEDITALIWHDLAPLQIEYFQLVRGFEYFLGLWYNSFITSE